MGEGMPPPLGVRAGASQPAYKVRPAGGVLEQVGMAPGCLKVLPAGDNLPAAGAIDHEHGSVAVDCLRGLVMPASERRLRLARARLAPRTGCAAFSFSTG